MGQVVRVTKFQLTPAFNHDKLDGAADIREKIWPQRPTETQHGKSLSRSELAKLERAFAEMRSSWKRAIHSFHSD